MSFAVKMMAQLGSIQGMQREGEVSLRFAAACVFLNTQRNYESHYVKRFSLDSGGTAANGGPLFVRRRRNTMTTPRARNGNLLAMRVEAGKQVDRIPASRFPVQHEIQHLQNELNAFNDRIIELENEGHRGHAMEVLKAKAIDFARQIDELRCLLVKP